MKVSHGAALLIAGVGVLGGLGVFAITNAVMAQMVATYVQILYVTATGLLVYFAVQSIKTAVKQRHDAIRPILVVNEVDIAKRKASR